MNYELFGIQEDYMKIGMDFQGDHIRLWANAFYAVFPGSSSLESWGIQYKTKS